MIDNPSASNNVFIEDLPEMKILREIFDLQASFRVFQKNYLDLLYSLENLSEGPDIELKYAYFYWNADKKEQYFDKISTLLHNFLASAKSLVDHTRRVKKKLYSAHPFQDEYQSKVDQTFTNSELQKFIQKLRNYAQHVTLPPISMSLSFDQAEGTHLNMELSREELLLWKTWEGSKSYLEKQPEGIDIKNLISNYYSLISEFYQWLHRRQQEIHKADLDKIRSEIVRQQEIHKADIENIKLVKPDFDKLGFSDPDL